MASCVLATYSAYRMFHRQLFRSTYSRVNLYSSRARPDPSTFLFHPDKVDIIEEVDQKFEAKKLKFRFHPGRLELPVLKVEPDIQKSIGCILVKGEEMSTYKAQVQRLHKKLDKRRLPLEPHDIRGLRSKIEQRVRDSLTSKGMGPESCETDDDRISMEQDIQRQSDERLRTSIYNWKAIEYNTPTKCVSYCILRFAPEYAALRRVFNEIVKRVPDFKPKEVFDFGSGVGSVYFATEKSWPEASVEEFFCVDPSEEMKDFFRLLLRDGEPDNEPRHRNVTFRSFLPATSDRKFDLVVSAYSMMELPSYEERMRTVANLWMKTKEFLVLIEPGSNAGFRAIIEARDYILAGAYEIYRNALPELAETKRVNSTDVELILKRNDLTEAQKFHLIREKYPHVEFPTLLPHGHVFAPCPHDMGCPRLLDVTPCNFMVRYLPLRLSKGEEMVQEEMFSFIILRKGYAPAVMDRWPRIVREPRKSKACIWCQTCSSHGVLEDKAFHKGSLTTERGKQFRIVKHSSWGDLLPMVSSYEAVSEERASENEQSDGEEESDVKMGDDSDKN